MGNIFSSLWRNTVMEQDSQGGDFSPWGGSPQSEDDGAGNIDFLSELRRRNCDHIINSILDSLGAVSLYNARQVSRAWQALVDHHVETRLSFQKKKCFREYTQFAERHIDTMDPEERKSKETAICQTAAICGDMELLQTIHRMRRGGSMPPVGAGGYLAHLAAKHGHLRMLEWLIETFPGDVDPMAKGKGDMNLLHLSAMGGHLDIMQMLHRRYRNRLTWSATATRKWTVAHLAVEEGHQHVIEWITQTFPGRKYLTNRDEYKQTVLHLATKKRHLGLLKYFHNNHSDILDWNEFNAKNDSELKIIHIAIVYRYIDVLEWLLATFPGRWNLKETDGKGRNLFHLASESGCLDTLKVLHQYSGHLAARFFEAVDDNSWTMCHYAAYQGRVDILQWLLDVMPTYVDIMGPDVNGKNILHLMAKMGNLDMMAYMATHHPERVDFTVNANDNQSLLHLATYSGHLGVIQWLLRTFPGQMDVKQKIVGGETILHLASRRGYLDILKYLRQRPGIQVDFLEEDAKGRTVVHDAVRFGRINVLEWALEDIPDLWTAVHESSPTRNNIVHMAVKAGQVKVLRYLHRHHRNKLEFRPKTIRKLAKYIEKDQRLAIEQWVDETFAPEEEEEAEEVEAESDNNDG